MKPNNSPFLNTTFQKLWMKHFMPSKSIKNFNCIDGVNFYEGNKAEMYFNVGRNLTKGNTYMLEDFQDFKNKTFIIYDVLPYLQNNNNNNHLSKHLGILKSVQYPGFLINLEKFKNLDEYLLNVFSKNTRSKMRKFSKRLDRCFDISTKMFFGEIDKDEYNFVFENFMHLLQKRYAEKQVYYNNMQPAEWNFYKEVALPLIQQKKASLFVIYDKNSPIAITYNYHTENTVIDAITVFDTDYSKFNIGYVNNLKLLDWCFKNNVSALDFSKGYFDYKKRMCTLEYDFEYHILFDKTSIRSKSLAYGYYYMFQLKAYLRRKKIDKLFHKYTYKFKNRKDSEVKRNFEILKLKSLPSKSNLKEIDIAKTEEYSFLKKCVYDFQYLAEKPCTQIKLYKNVKEENTFVLLSDALIQQIVLK